ncbi:competence type IV pilus ATPase ComGA [Virgibacillus kimchii]
MSDAAQLSNKLIREAIQAQASDIHFYPFKDRSEIYFRIQGKRTRYQSMRIEQYQHLITYYKFTSGMDIGESRKPQNGVLTHQLNTQLFSLRLSTLPVNDRESLAIRILPQEKDLSLDHLFLFPSQLKKLKKWISHRTGIILFTGPTGSGKTTTLYALLETILKEKSYQAITLEDPIEKQMKHILQVQVNEKAGITYQTGLKAALRHDPDIIMVGEIRDAYTAHFAFDASLTGHLVLSTLHARNTKGTIHRLLEMGLSRTDLEQSLIAIASLQLLPLSLQKYAGRRGAILELLDGGSLANILEGAEPLKQHNYHTFEHLRKKAFAYGYISKEIYQTEKE